MDKFRITGGRPLEGRVRISGAKNSALPCMAAALLTGETVTLHNLPYARDIITMRRLLEDLGSHVLMPELCTLNITADRVEFFEAPYELVKTMRASVLALGPLLARFGEARVSLPGGCAIGQRPIDLHLSAFEKLGASVSLEGGTVVARADRLQGREVYFDKVTVTGTENLMMAAALAEGETILNNAAREPEVVDLAELLNKMGARIEGAGQSTIRIEGVEKLGGAEHTIIADRIETGTFIAAAAITGGQLDIVDCNPQHLTAVLDKLRETGIRIEQPNRNFASRERKWSPETVGRDHASSSGFSDRHAGAVHDADDACRRNGYHHRDDIRESFYARGRVDENGRAHTTQRATGCDRRRSYIDGRSRAGIGLESIGLARYRRACGEGRNHN